MKTSTAEDNQSAYKSMRSLVKNSRRPSVVIAVVKINKWNIKHVKYMVDLMRMYGVH
jgi:hypothetical protein